MNDKQILTVMSKLNEFMMKTSKKKVTKKASDKKFFYVGSETVCNSAWLKTSLQEAIDHATALCEEKGRQQYVVKVVAIVKPKKVSNVIVEMLK